MDSTSSDEAEAIDTLDIKNVDSTTSNGHISNSSTQAQLRGLTDAALKFLSSASNETLGACAVGLCASTYLVLGRVGLVLIGAVGGIVLHATWDGPNDDGDAAQGGSQKGLPKRRELGIEIAKRALDWRDRRGDARGAEEEEDGETGDPGAMKPSDYSDFQPATKGALTELTEAIVRDYVRWWYSPILPSETSFPAACKQTVTSFIMSISNHLSKKRPADPFLDFLAHSTSIVVIFLSELSTALRASPGQLPEDAIKQYLQQEPDSSLANVLSKQQQQHKLRLVADDVLANFFDSKAFHFSPSKIFLREILAGVVLETTVNTCSQPEWINGWILHLLEDGEPGIMNAIDVGVETPGSPTAGIPKSPFQVDEEKRHARRISKAEEAMQEAMLEAKRMNEMIAEEEARRKRDLPPVGEYEDATSTATTEGIATPTSSDSDRNRVNEKSLDSSVVLQQQTADEGSRQELTPAAAIPQTFTDFDQLVRSQIPTALEPHANATSPTEPISECVLTLHNAAITILDDGDANEKSTFRSKPAVTYLMQVEPSVSRFPGWMMARKYQDFETLHEVLGRISIISGVFQFTERYAALPSWRGQSKAHLRTSLEQYLQHALQHERLAESEAMKKFLEKETGLGKTPNPSKNVFLQGPAALESMGKGFVNALGQAPKGIAGGGKAVLGGVQGVFGAVGATKKAGHESVTSDKSRFGHNPRKPEAEPSRPTQEADAVSSEISSDVNVPRPLSTRQSTEVYEVSGQSSLEIGQNVPPQESLHLPPPPSDISDDYGQPRQGERQTREPASPATVREGGMSLPSPTGASVDSERSRIKRDSPIRAKNTPLTEGETRVSIELIFAIIAELYSLSSAWTIRLSLLSAAKTFLLRPNNPQLESIRLLIQDSMIDTNLVSDAGVAGHIQKLRQNTLPTEEEAKEWPAPMNEADKEKLRIKARKLLVERGMPQALTSVMGNAASSEALGRFFDCLQVEQVARGLVFALLLQALRAVTQ